MCFNDLFICLFSCCWIDADDGLNVPAGFAHTLHRSTQSVDQQPRPGLCRYQTRAQLSMSVSILWSTVILFIATADVEQWARRARVDFSFWKNDMSQKACRNSNGLWGAEVIFVQWLTVQMPSFSLSLSLSEKRNEFLDPFQRRAQ